MVLQIENRLTSLRLLTIKGAPDVLIGRCSYFLAPTGEVLELTSEAKATFEHIKNMYSSQGKRCILLARKLIKGGKIGDTADYEPSVMEESKTGLVLVGFVAIVDPLRPEIREVVSTLRGASIRIAMVRPPTPPSWSSTWSTNYSLR